MKTLFILISIIIISGLFILFALGKYSQKGHASGLLDGSLSKCSAKPNCVCSEYANDIDHYIAPIKDHLSIELNNISIAAATIQEMGGTINRKTGEYIAATFTSSIFGFVDDLEIRNDKIHGILHIRSASRVGYSDGGINRKRTELFKKIYAQNIEKSNKEVLDHMNDG